MGVWSKAFQYHKVFYHDPQEMGSNPGQVERGGVGPMPVRCRPNIDSLLVGALWLSSLNLMDSLLLPTTDKRKVEELTGAPLALQNSKQLVSLNARKR